MTALPITLSDSFSPVVNKGDTVIVGQIIAKHNSSAESIINIPSGLSITIRQAKKAVKKIPGEKVQKGDIVAARSSFFGGDTVLRSNVDGTVIRYERDSGNLVVKTTGQATGTSEPLTSPVDGIVKLCDNSEIVIDTDKNVLVGAVAIGNTAQGEILVVNSADPYYLNASAIEKVVVGERFSREMMVKGIGIGVTGMVGVEIEEGDILHLKEKSFTTPVIQIGKEDFAKIANWNGKKVFLNPDSKSIILLSL